MMFDNDPAIGTIPCVDCGTPCDDLYDGPMRCDACELAWCEEREAAERYAESIYVDEEVMLA